MSETEEITRALVPEFADDGRKSKYLSYRIAFFNMRESITLSGIHETTVRRWRRDDPKFLHMDTEGLPELRKQLSDQYINVEFTRNFHLVLQKDFKVLYKDAQNESLTDKEYNYLLKLRNHYTPQQLAMIKQLLAGGSMEQPFDFTKLVVTIRRERQEIEMRTEG